MSDDDPAKPDDAAKPGAPPTDDVGTPNVDLIPWIKLQ
jgi:hypothetical protein